MKNIFLKIFLIAAVVVLAASCKKKIEPEQPDLPVNYANVAGKWQLTSWRGAALAEGTWCYIEFTRGDKRFTIHQNFDSMYDRVLTGDYVIDVDDYEKSILNGQYDWDKGWWSNTYYVTKLKYDGSSMTWTSTTNPSDVSVYTRIEAFPEFD